MSRAWFSQPERSSAFWISLIRWIALHLGRPVTRLLLHPITLYFFLFSSHARRASRQYLRRSLDHKPTVVDQFRHIHSFASTILDRVYLLTGQEHLLDIHIHDADIPHTKVAAGQGCILLGSHLGSFELLRALAVHTHHFPLKVLMYADHNETITRILDVLSPEVANTVIPLGRPETLLQVKESLDQGFLIGILGDRVAENDRQMKCEFLGAPATFPTGPLLLAVTLNVPVILFYGLYQKGRRYDIHFELLTEAPNVERANRQPKIENLTCHYAKRLAHYTRQAPYNWFNFYEFWHDA